MSASPACSLVVLALVAVLGCLGGTVPMRLGADMACAAPAMLARFGLPRVSSALVVRPSSVSLAARPLSLRATPSGGVRCQAATYTPTQNVLSKTPIKKVVLAYSGGLDTSVIVAWLRENYDCEVICMTADIGQGAAELDGLEAKALDSGASRLVVKDLRRQFLTDFVFPCLRAGAIYENKYLLGTSMARPLIAKAMVEVAREFGADAVAHGCTGKGNDQVRFELAFFALAPDLTIVAPWRHWEIKGREDAIAYCEARNIPVTATRAKIYSRDRNLWHMSHEGGVLEDPAEAPLDDMFSLTSDPAEGPDSPLHVRIGFEAGIPVSVNGDRLDPVDLVQMLNELGGCHGVGRLDLVENRVVGLKSRGVYETPGGTILFEAARALETLTMDRDALLLKQQAALTYSQLVYEGKWWSVQRRALDALMETLAAHDTGEVIVKLFKGSATVVSRQSPNSIYDQGLVSFEDGAGGYDQGDATGFINIFGLSTRIQAFRDGHGSV